MANLVFLSTSDKNTAFPSLYDDDQVLLNSCHNIPYRLLPIGTKVTRKWLHFPSSTYYTVSLPSESLLDAKKLIKSLIFCLNLLCLISTMWLTCKSCWKLRCSYTAGKIIREYMYWVGMEWNLTILNFGELSRLDQFGRKSVHNALLFNKPISDYNSALNL